MPKDKMSMVTYCPKTLCPIWQFAHEDILPKDFLPKLTICPKKTNCPRQHFAHILGDFCSRIFVLLIQILEGLLLIHFMIMQQKTSFICISNQKSTSCIYRIRVKKCHSWLECHMSTLFPKIKIKQRRDKREIREREREREKIG